MAVAFVTSNSAIVPDTGTGDHTSSFDAGSADFMIGIVGYTHGAAARTATMSFNNTGLVSVASISSPTTTFTGITLFKWPDNTSFPAAGAHNLTVAMSANADDMVYGFMSFSGCHAVQDGTPDTSTGIPIAGTPQPAPSVTGVTDGIVVGAVCDNAAAASVSPGDTERWENTSATNNQTTVNVETATFVGSGTMDWTCANFVNWAAAAFPIKPAAASSVNSGFFMVM